MEIRRTEERCTRILAEFEAEAAEKWSTGERRKAASLVFDRLIRQWHDDLSIPPLGKIGCERE
jgi:hypothetical protein